MKAKIISHTENPELVIATAAKLCYAGCNIDELMDKQTPEGIEKFIAMLEEMGHESPMEHVSFTFAIEGVSRVLEQQLTRHRIASYSIQSGRYVDRSNATFYTPKDIEECPEAKIAYTAIQEQSKNSYEKITNALLHHFIIQHDIETNFMEKECPYSKGHYYENEKSCIDFFEKTHKAEFRAMKKRAIENARFSFLNSIETKIICTMNVRTLLNFFKHRCCNRAQDEIRELAKILLKLVKEIAPNLFRHAGAACACGICPEGKMQCSQLKGRVPNNIEVKKLIKQYYTKEWREINS